MSIPMLKPGDPAPSFSLPADAGRQVDSAQLAGRRYVLFFYPKDDTPGCTREACAFRDKLPAFEKLGVPVYGVSADTPAKHDRFAGKHSLNFPLLSDPGHELLEAYGVWIEKSWEKVSPDSHASEVLAYLSGATAPKSARKPR